MSVKVIAIVGLGTVAMVSHHVADWSEIYPSGPDHLPTQASVTMQSSTGSGLDVQRFEAVRDESITWRIADHKPVPGLGITNGNATISAPSST
jgi:hypothetical protein